MKFHSSLRTKCYLNMAPLVGLFLALTLTMVHGTWQIKAQVAQVESTANDVLWGGRLARGSDRYQVDYWEMLATRRRSEAEQVEQDASEVEQALEHFRRENKAAGDANEVAQLRTFSKDFALTRQSVAESVRRLADEKAGPEVRSAEIEAGRRLAQALAPARNFAEVSERAVERATSNLMATSKAMFWRNSTIYRAAERVVPEAHEIALVQRVSLGFGDEMNALAQYRALQDGSAFSAQRLYELRHRRAKTVAALEALEKSEEAEADDTGKKLVEAIGRRYETVVFLSSRLIELPAEARPQRREELEEKLEAEVNGLHASMEELASKQAADLRTLTAHLRSALHRTEALIAGLCGFFLFIAAGVPYMLVRKIMAPVSTLTAAIHRFKDGDLRTKVPATSNDEMGELATGFNAMTHALAENIEERRRAEQMALDREEQVRLLLDSTAESIYGIDLQGHCTFCNPACVRQLGYQQADELLGKNMHHLIHHSHADGTGMPIEACRIFQAFRVGMGSHVDSEVLWKADGTSFPAEYWSYPQKHNGQTVGAVVTFIDITERKEAEAKIESLAYFDALTGLPNRVLLQDRLSKALARARRHREKVAVLFLDLDGFKVINDSLGHSVGDVLLKQVAERLQGCAREQDTVARLGGDEFVVLLTDVKEVADVAVAADRIRSALMTEFVVLEHALHVSCSLGVSLFPDHGNDGGSLVKHADAAMYRAKDTGRNNVQFFTEGINAEVMERMVLENSLRRALEKNELYLVYQPQVDIATGEMVGTEALARWKHPELGLVPPAKFIPIAENSGLIIPIGEWVLRTACLQAKRWQQDGLPALPVAVNVSAVQFRQTGFVELIRTILSETGLDAHLLELEITETLIISNADVTVAVFKKLNELGVRLSIDDFGTGYSSLSYLKHFPISKLKIDRSFVRDLAVDQDDAAITGTIISMAKSLGMRVIAEGVEQRQQLAFLRSHDCDEAQGFFFSKPVLAGDLAALRKKFLANRKPGVFVAD